MGTGHGILRSHELQQSTKDRFKLESDIRSCINEVKKIEVRLHSEVSTVEY